ncbi:MAG TPA: prepilin-type N-terminal cleavage/methylation domain-containing protein [Candidatus Paceibacterota bacterium]|nr:prepilin-type N-terminal cleavage/methylation domain-containing protein [Candidatus Paceibacterota bacterium]
MKTVKFIGKQRREAYSLIEMLVYIGVLAVLMAAGYAALFRSMEHSVALRRNTQDISNALRVGEIWRADLRQARAVRLETNGVAPVLHLVSAGKTVDYRFVEQALERRVGNGGWSQMLSNVKASDFVSDSQSGVRSWRWELELQSRKKSPRAVQPLFTFTAVPTGKIAK